jgi:radical SAM protein with 4Fe4S-binding SPASM domain
LAPDKASLITTNELGSKFVEYFSKNLSIKEVMEEMKSKGVKMSTIQSELNNFLIKVEKNGFYEDSVVKEVDIKPSLQIDITNKCNLTCVHCLRDAGKPSENELDTPEWLKVIDDFSSLFKTDVTISGGEPLVHPGFFNIIKKAKEKGLGVTLFTNGVLINEEYAKKLQGYVKRIQVSLDGATEEVNDKIRGRGSFGKVLKAVSLLYDTDIVLDMAFSLMPSNLKNFYENIEELIKTVGPKINFKLSEVVKFGRADSTHMFPDKNGRRLEPEAKKLRDHLYKRRLKAPPGSSKNIMLLNCGYGEMVTISSVGDIYPCPLYESSVKHGNIRNDDFKEILKKIDADRQKCSTKNMEECKTCDLRSRCSGGCRINNIYYNGDILKPECIQKPDYKDWMYSVIMDHERNNPRSLWLGKE